MKPVSCMALAWFILGCGGEKPPAPAPAVPGAPARAQAPPAGVKWNDVGQTWQGDGIEIEVRRAWIGTVRLRMGEVESEPDEKTGPRCCIAIEIKNRTESRKMEFSPDVSTRIFVVDELGNDYSAFNLAGSAKLAASVSSAKSISIEGEPLEWGALYPGKSVRTVICAEPPVDAATELRITIGGAGVGLKSDAHLRIKAPANE